MDSALGPDDSHRNPVSCLDFPRRRVDRRPSHDGFCRMPRSSTKLNDGAGRRGPMCVSRTTERILLREKKRRKSEVGLHSTLCRLQTHQLSSQLVFCFEMSGKARLWLWNESCSRVATSQFLNTVCANKLHFAGDPPVP